MKGELKKGGQYGHRASDFWGNSNKGNENRNENENRKPRLNGDCNNCGKIGHRAVGYWVNKGKYKDYDVNNLFVRATFCGELQEDDK